MHRPARETAELEKSVTFKYEITLSTIMVQPNIEHQHQNTRKRIHNLHPDKYKNFLDKIIYPVGLLGPLMMIPQIMKIYIEKDASSIALTSWILFLFPAILWTIYGISHKEKAIMVYAIRPFFVPCARPIWAMVKKGIRDMAVAPINGWIFLSLFLNRTSRKITTATIESCGILKPSPKGTGDHDTAR